MKYIILITTLFALLFGQIEWTIPLYIGNPALPEYEDTFFIGVKNGATSGYDSGIDVAAGVPPPSGFFPYLVIQDTMFPGLTVLMCDYRDVNGTYHLWELVVQGNESDSFTLRLDVDSFPYPCDTPIFLQYLASEDMPAISDWDTAPCLTSTSNLGIFPARKHIFVQYIDLNYAFEYNQKHYLLIKALPNPFNERCIIKIENLEKPDYMRIYNYMGKKIEEFFIDAGYQSVVWNPSNITSGVYTACLGTTRTKIIIIK